MLLECYDKPELINVGSGQEVSIAEVAEKIAEAVGYEGKIRLDPSKPDGTPRKLMDNSRINALGWRPGTTLEQGLSKAYADFCSNAAT